MTIRNIALKLLARLMRWPPHWSYFFANVIIIDPKTRNIILSQSEDRKETTPFGGEAEAGEQGRETAVREVREETKKLINPEPEDLIELDLVRVHPDKNSDGITRDVQTFVYFMRDTDTIPTIEKQVHEEGCRIVKVINLPLPEIMDKVKTGEIVVHSNFIGTLAKLETFLANKHSSRFWAYKIMSSLSDTKQTIYEMEKIGAFNVRYDSLDDQEFWGNIPDAKKSQLRKYLKSIGCTNIRIEK